MVSRERKFGAVELKQCLSVQQYRRASPQIAGNQEAAAQIDALAEMVDRYSDEIDSLSDIYNGYPVNNDIQSTKRL